MKEALLKHCWQKGSMCKGPEVGGGRWERAGEKSKGKCGRRSRWRGAGCSKGWTWPWGQRKAIVALEAGQLVRRWLIGEGLTLCSNSCSVPCVFAFVSCIERAAPGFCPAGESTDAVQHREQVWKSGTCHRTWHPLATLFVIWSQELSQAAPAWSPSINVLVKTVETLRCVQEIVSSVCKHNPWLSLCRPSHTRSKLHSCKPRWFTTERL